MIPATYCPSQKPYHKLTDLDEPDRDAECSRPAKGGCEEEHADLGQAAPALRRPRRRARQLHAHVRDHCG